MQTHPIGALLVVAALTTVSSPATVYVDQAATGAGDGGTWANAFTNLQAALATTPTPNAYWVRAGRYGPCTLRTNSLVYGGFSGTETLLESRDWRANLTTIDGQGSRAVTFAAAALLDGFVITNSVGQGGAAFFDRVQGVLDNCRIVGHTGGDAIVLQSTGANTGAATLIRNCEFLDNRDGAAIFYYGRTNIYLGPHLVTIDRCTFAGNRTTGRGAAIRTDHAGHWLRIENSVFTGNSADLSGGALYVGYSQYGPGTPVAIWNCTFHGNTAPAAKTLLVGFEAARADLRNCVVWGATNDQLRTQNGFPTLRIGQSALQGGFASTNPRDGVIEDLGGLLDADPQFADPTGVDDVAGTRDDDFRLTATSPCIDAGTATGAPAHDRDGQYRPRGSAPDLGAYEFPGGPLPTGALFHVY